jgi:hypothetical protein
MEYYINRFEVILSNEDYESKHNSQSYEVMGIIVNRFKDIFPSATINGVKGSTEEFSDGNIFGFKFIVDIETDISPLEIAEKQAEIYIKN